MFSYGNKFKVSIYGASHEETMGLLIEGIKPGFTIDIDDINKDLDLRRPGMVGTTKRVEGDQFEIVNGYFNNKTTGAPLHIVVRNSDVKSTDYSNLKDHFRPNHADFTANIKYGGYNDYRGGGIFSGRLTTLLVIAGSIAKSFLPFNISSELIKVGTHTNMSTLDEYLQPIIEQKDSVGGEVVLRVSNVSPGIGDPYFNKLDASISHIIMTVPGVRGVIFGDNFSTDNYGSVNNDLIMSKDGTTKTNYSGGIVGGISNGNDIVLKVLVKPTSSIGIEQETYNYKNNKSELLKITGRHDVAFVKRIPIVLESVIAICLANY